MNIFPSRLVDSVNGMIGKVKVLVLRSALFVNNTLHLKDQDGNDITTVDVGIDNVGGLQSALDSKVSQINVLDQNTSDTLHRIGQIGTTVINETVTRLNPLELQGNRLYIKLFNENNVEQVVSIDLSSLSLNETGISNATYDASQNIITLTENDGDVWQINLSEFSIITSTDANGITTVEQEGVIKLTVSRVGQTGEFSHLLNIPTTLAGFGLLSEADNRYVNVGEDISWDNIIDRPTTLAGYGITDAYTKAYIDSNYYTAVQSDNRFFNVTGDDVVGDSSFTGKTTYDGNVYYNTQNGQKGVYLSRYEESPNEFVKMYLEDIVANFYYLNDERHARFKWTINNTDTESNAGANANLHTFEFLGNEFGAFLYLDGNELVHAGNINNFTAGSVAWANVTGKPTTLSGYGLLAEADGRYLQNEVNDLTSAVTWTTVPNAYISQQSVTQHQGALSITESQISNLGDYLLKSGGEVTGNIILGTGADVLVGGNRYAFRYAVSQNYGLFFSTSDGEFQFLNSNAAVAQAFNPDTGATRILGTLTANTIVKSGSSDSFLLLGGGGTKPVSDFLSSGALSGYATEAYVNTQVASLVDTAPGTLDTLNELAAALGDDPNFATTISNQIGTKANNSVSILPGTGLSGGGDLTANRTLSFDTTWGDNRYLRPSALDGYATESWVNSQDFEGDSQVITLKVHKSQLTSTDKTGLIQYWNQQGFSKLKRHTIIFEIDETDFSAEVVNPSEGMIITAGEVYTIITTVGGAPDAVEFYIDGSKVGESTVDPYTFDWNASSGMHDIYLKVIDNGVEVASSSTVNFEANYVPVANDDSYTVEENKILTVAAPGVLANDTDFEGDAMAALLNEGPTNGTVDLEADGSFIYTPNTDFFGTDSFSYIPIDEHSFEQGAFNVATVTITVTESLGWAEPYVTGYKARVNADYGYLEGTEQELIDWLENN